MHISASSVITSCGLPVPEEEQAAIPTDRPVTAVIIPSDDPDEWMGHAFCKVCEAIARHVMPV